MIIELHSDDMNNNNNIQDVIQFFPWFSFLVYRKIIYANIPFRLFQ